MAIENTLYHWVHNFPGIDKDMQCAVPFYGTMAACKFHSDCRTTIDKVDNIFRGIPFVGFFLYVPGKMLCRVIVNLGLYLYHKTYDKTSEQGRLYLNHSWAERMKFLTTLQTIKESQNPIEEFLKSPPVMRNDSEFVLSVLRDRPDVDWKREHIENTLLMNEEFLKGAVTIRLKYAKLIENPSEKLILWLAKNCPRQLLSQNGKERFSGYLQRLYDSEDVELKEQEAELQIKKVPVERCADESPNVEVLDMLSLQDLKLLQTIRETAHVLNKEELCRKSAAQLENNPDLALTILMQQPDITLGAQAGSLIAMCETYIRKMEHCNPEALEHIGTNQVVTPEMIKYYYEHKENPLNVDNHGYMLARIALKGNRVRGIPEGHIRNGSFMAAALLLNPNIIQLLATSEYKYLLKIDEFVKSICSAIHKKPSIFRVTPADTREALRPELEKSPDYENILRFSAPNILDISSGIDEAASNMEDD